MDTITFQKLIANSNNFNLIFVKKVDLEKKTSFKIVENQKRSFFSFKTAILQRHVLHVQNKRLLLFDFLYILFEIFKKSLLRSMKPTAYRDDIAENDLI